MITRQGPGLLVDLGLSCGNGRWIYSIAMCKTQPHVDRQAVGALVYQLPLIGCGFMCFFGVSQLLICPSALSGSGLPEHQACSDATTCQPQHWRPIVWRSTTPYSWSQGFGNGVAGPLVRMPSSLTLRNATTRLLILPRLNFKIDTYTYRSSDRETPSSP
jgi:hypothetical protein